MPATTSTRLDEREFVLAKCRYFVDAQVWPAQTLFPEQWLENFTEDELPYAVHLLNQFLFFSDQLTDALLFGGLMELSRRMVDVTGPITPARVNWAQFLDNVLVTYPTGEEPRPTDSGYSFARKARQVLSFREDQILSPEATLKYMVANGPRPVLFLDDFLGTGRQFLATWTRRYKINGIVLSLEELHAQARFTAYYAPLFATKKGLRGLKERAVDVIFAPTHILPPQYSALHSESFAWPDNEAAAGRKMIAEASARASIPDKNGAVGSDWQGFGKLGLCLGFEHGVPDATLPIFYWNRNSWNPLVHRK